MRIRIEAIASSVVAIATVVVAVTYVSAQMNGRQGAGTPAPTFFPNWKAITPQGHVVGSAQAIAVIVEFSDFQCPYCRQFHQRLEDLRQRYGDQIAYSYVHLPLANHPYARPAALAADCAAEQDRFDDFASQLFAAQDSLSHVQLATIALRSGIRDTTEFSACLRRPGHDLRVKRNEALAKQLGFRSTPIVFLNGWKFVGLPDSAEFESAMKRAMAGKSPVRPWWRIWRG